MFDDTLDAVKKYWPYALGIVAVGFLVTRGGGSSAPANNGMIMYDPNLLQAETERLAIQTTADAQVSQAAIQAQAMVEMSQLQAIAGAFDSLATLNDSFVHGNVATYQAIKDQSIAAMNSGAQITSAGLLAAGAAQQSFNETVGDLGIASGNIVTAVAAANAQSGGGFGNILSTAIRAYAFM